MELDGIKRLLKQPCLKIRRRVEYVKGNDRFIIEVYDEVKDFPPMVNGKRNMPRSAAPGR
jgi:hypothetical protein